MEKRKDTEEGSYSRDKAMDTDDVSNSKVVFKKQSSSKEHRKPSFNQSALLRRKIDTNQESDEKSTLKGSKVVMPEYVIGQKVSNKTKNKAIKHQAADTIQSGREKKPHLQHLFDDEEEDEEEDED